MRKIACKPPRREPREQAESADPGITAAAGRVVVLDGAVEVFTLDLRCDAWQAVDARAYLTPAERWIAGRLRSDQRRAQYIAARALLRLLLAERLGVEPQALTITSSSHGKPRLTGAQRNAWRFNVSHSCAVVLIALCRDHPVGVDVEQLRSTRWRSLLARICDSRELTEARAEVPLAGECAFFERWVAKEAVLKALGMGMTVSPALVGLRRSGDGDLRVCGALPGPSRSTCQLVPLEMPAGFVAALAVIPR
ncbi:MAG TPA: 4'-phosphopantetheinyl transferase superfamily protein [Solirubrobacteraceae bacterium]|jgi:4'-phosphopantetheinyl transferase|nr:4'-phosphopantetheinyl transferase superfamily protein [Solirubrobacteraceae bacterium]